MFSIKPQKVKKDRVNVPFHPPDPEPFTAKLSARAVEDIFADCYDFQKRELKLALNRGEVTVCFIDGLVSGSEVAEQVIRPITSRERLGCAKNQRRALELIARGGAYGHTANVRENINDVVSDLIRGYCAVIFDDIAAAVTFEVRTQEKRSIDEPKEEKSIKGSKDVFIEMLKTNTMLVRRHLPDPFLKFRSLTIGRRSKTTVTIVYIANMTNMLLVEELEKRISSIDIQAVTSAGDIEQYIADRPRCAFPQLLRTERPDRFCTNLLEGRVGLLVDGLPMGFLAPASFVQFMKMPEDNAYHFITASILTLLRYFAITVSLLLPAVYVAVAMYHQEMLPTRLMQTIIASKQAVPFPTAVEILSMLAAFELLQEAGLRLPDTVGKTVSIIGALIVGQSAVDAKVASPVVVIVVALAGIAGYTIPNQDLSAAVRIWRFAFVIAAVCGGFFPVMSLFCLLIYRLCSLDSFGVDYMYPFSQGGAVMILRALLKPPLYSEKLRWPDTGSVDRRKQR